MELNLLWLIIAILGVWRVTHLLAAEDGPFDIFVRLRRVLGNGFWGKLLDCFYCLSVWIAAPVAGLLAHSRTEWLLLWLAVSGGACLCEKMTTKNDLPKVEYYEDEAGH